MESDEKYREALKSAKADWASARQELAEIRKRQEHLQSRILALREIVVATSKMLGEEFVEEDELGLTETIRQVYKTATTPLSTFGVEKQLNRIGYDLGKYDSPESATASISKVVTRLAERGELKPAGKNAAGRQLYRRVAEP